MQLRRGDVLAGALSILGEYGLADLTMRRLATSLGVQPGALYWHFPNKQTLLGAMVDTILGGVESPAQSQEWNLAFDELAHRLRAALLAHRDGAELVTAAFASRLTSSTVRDSFAHIGLNAGLSRPQAELASYALLYYVLGHTVDEQARVQMEEAGALTRAPISPEAAPQSGGGAGADTGAAADEDLLDGDPAVRFDFGLDLFIDGIRARLRASADSR